MKYLVLAVAVVGEEVRQFFLQEVAVRQVVRRRKRK